jgi:hypothetical protein
VRETGEWDGGGIETGEWGGGGVQGARLGSGEGEGARDWGVGRTGSQGNHPAWPLGFRSPPSLCSLCFCCQCFGACVTRPVYPRRPPRVIYPPAGIR